MVVCIVWNLFYWNFAFCNSQKLKIAVRIRSEYALVSALPDPIDLAAATKDAAAGAAADRVVYFIVHVPIYLPTQIRGV